MASLFVYSLLFFVCILDLCTTFNYVFEQVQRFYRDGVGFGVAAYVAMIFCSLAIKLGELGLRQDLLLLSNTTRGKGGNDLGGEAVFI